MECKVNVLLNKSKHNITLLSLLVGTTVNDRVISRGFIIADCDISRKKNPCEKLLIYSKGFVTYECSCALSSSLTQNEDRANSGVFYT